MVDKDFLSTIFAATRF